MKPYYEDASVVIYHGEALDTLRQLPSGTTDVVLVDPPYSSGGMYRGDRLIEPAVKYRGWSQEADGSRRPPTAEYGSFGGDNRDQRGYLAWVGAWQFQALRTTVPGGFCFMFTDWRQLPITTDYLGRTTTCLPWPGLIVWDKGVGRPVKGRFRNHLEFIVWATNGGTVDAESVYPSALVQVATVSPGERQHVTQKPTELLRHLLTVVPGDHLRVLDPFMGSGSTLRAAKDCGHTAIGIEADERYCEIAAHRMAQEVLAL